LDFEPKVEPPKPASEEAPEEVADIELGRSADGKSRRLRNKYLCSIGEKQMPPGVHQALLSRKISRKRGEYQKRMAKRQEQADALMLQSEMEIPTVEALMVCPLSRFIHFAANECGYKGTRYKLVADWVHPLFLKAKSEASKEDNLSWKQAMNGPFKAEYWEAALKRLKLSSQWMLGRLLIDWRQKM
jgi:hypothetical protein